MDVEQKNELTFDAAVNATFLNALSILSQITNLATRELANEKDPDVKKAKIEWVKAKFDKFEGGVDIIRNFLD